MNDAVKSLIRGNERFVSHRGDGLKKHVAGQHPRVAVLTCSDSRVVPEFIFDADIGEIFVVRVAGNVAMDTTVLESLEYAVEHLNVEILLILGHTNCGAVCAAEECMEDEPDGLLKEIRECFSTHGDHFLANTLHQLDKLPLRSQAIAKAIEEGRLKLIGAMYHLDTGKVEFL
ncbi:MAG: carbonic anhydrase [Thermoplasmata archaeon]|nr:carbonic anhydrase [Thermoplasmata archaeon]